MITATSTLTAEQRRIVEWGDGPAVVIAGESMGAVLAMAGRDCQIILTCPPNRYEFVGSATVVRLG